MGFLKPLFGLIVSDIILALLVFLLVVAGGGAGDFIYVVSEEGGRKQINDWSASGRVQGEEEEGSLLLWELLQFVIQ